VFARDGYVPIYPEIIKSKDVVVSGFFQSTKYFPELRNELIKDFQLKEDISEDNKQWIHQFENSQSVCFHIRRGDYAVENRAHCTLSYYRRAMVEIEKRVSNPHFFVFSDDLEWVKNNIDFGSRNITYVNSNNDSCNELNIMKHCKHFVLSNSTFSWWAQYLSESEKKVVIAPRPWLRRIPSDIYMENWVTLSVYE
jgi:hypothetical protein